jgi:SAM-dependent methyltransferase
MLELARGNATKAGAANVEFLKGTIEDVPLPDASIDVVISNCVINLSIDKPKVISEMYRVLVPGGRIGISNVVAQDHLTPVERVSAARTSAVSPARSPAASTWHISLRPVSETRPYDSPSRPPTACTAPSSKRRNPGDDTQSPETDCRGHWHDGPRCGGHWFRHRRATTVTWWGWTPTAGECGGHRRCLDGIDLGFAAGVGGFNPIITLIEAVQGTLQRRHAAAVVAAQVGGGIVGAVLANLMFGESAVSIAHTSREGLGIWLAEVVATAGLVIVIMGTIRSRRPGSTAFAVGAYMIAAYWFTSSTSFANPAVTIARTLSDSFAGISPSSVLGSYSRRLLAA